MKLKSLNFEARVWIIRQLRRVIRTIDRGSIPACDNCGREFPPMYKQSTRMTGCCMREWSERYKHRAPDSWKTYPQGKLTKFSPSEADRFRARAAEIAAAKA